MTRAAEVGSDRRVALALALAYLACLILSAKSLGYARDEGFYFQAARAYRGWFDLLENDPGAALTRAAVERYWSVNHEHPPLMKVCFMLSERIFHSALGWLSEPGTAYRLPGMLIAALAVATIHSWGSRVFGRAAGVVAALSFALMPRVFFHAHLACFDVPIASLWLVCAYAYFRSLSSNGRAWSLWTGVCYGLMLLTKHNAWLFPIVIALHALILRFSDLASGRPLRRPLVPAALLAMALIGPLLFFAGWPWLWFDTLARVLEYVRFHMQHEYYNMEFLGQTYWKPPMPVGYAWLMTLATVPLCTLLLALIGVVNWLFRERGKDAHATFNPREHTSPVLLWCLAVFVSYAPWLSDKTPIFGGTKHWLTAYPFLCLLAARGFQCARAELEALLAERAIGTRRVGQLLALAVSVGPLVMTIDSHPFGLSFYTPLVGGAPGAANLGLNRTFWGYTIGSLTGFLNERAPIGASVYVHDTALQSWQMLEEDGRLREDLVGTLSIAGSSLALYQHEPHMSRVEYQIWVDYGTLVPSHIASYEGVPITWIYERP